MQRKLVGIVVALAAIAAVGQAEEGKKSEMAEREAAAEAAPECAKIVPQCKAAGFEPGQHRKTGKGLWVDCVGAIARGRTIAGVNATKDEARSCRGVARASRRSAGAAGAAAPAKK